MISHYLKNLIIDSSTQNNASNVIFLIILDSQYMFFIFFVQNQHIKSIYGIYNFHQIKKQVRSMLTMNISMVIFVLIHPVVIYSGLTNIATYSTGTNLVRLLTISNNLATFISRPNTSSQTYTICRYNVDTNMTTVLKTNFTHTSRIFNSPYGSNDQTNNMFFIMSPSNVSIYSNNFTVMHSNWNPNSLTGTSIYKGFLSPDKNYIYDAQQYGGMIHIIKRYTNNRTNVVFEYTVSQSQLVTLYESQKLFLISQTTISGVLTVNIRIINSTTGAQMNKTSLLTSQPTIATKIIASTNYVIYYIKNCYISLYNCQPGNYSLIWNWTLGFNFNEVKITDSYFIVMATTTFIQYNISDMTKLMQIPLPVAYPASLELSQHNGYLWGAVWGGNIANVYFYNITKDYYCDVTVNCTGCEQGYCLDNVTNYCVFIGYANVCPSQSSNQTSNSTSNITNTTTNTNTTVNSTTNQTANTTTNTTANSTTNMTTNQTTNSSANTTSNTSNNNSTFNSTNNSTFNSSNNQTSNSTND